MRVLCMWKDKNMGTRGSLLVRYAEMGMPINFDFSSGHPKRKEINPKEKSCPPKTTKQPTANPLFSTHRYSTVQYRTAHSTVQNGITNTNVLYRPPFLHNKPHPPSPFPSINHATDAVTLTLPPLKNMNKLPPFFAFYATNVYTYCTCRHISENPTVIRHGYTICFSSYFFSLTK